MRAPRRLCAELRSCSAVRFSTCARGACSADSWGCSLLSETVEARRVVDEYLSALLRVGYPCRKQIDEIAVIRHILVESRVRPVGPPQHAARRGFDERL